MVSLRQEQNPIMKFAAPYLKMLAHCMLWRAQFLSDFYAVFCIHQILILLPLLSYLGTEGVPKSQNIFFYFWL